MAEEAARTEVSNQPPQARVQPRVAVNGKVRLVADTPEGLVTLSGELVDLSVSGCAIRVYAPLEPRGEARLELTVDGRQVWVSGHVVWTRVRQRAWIAGIRFDRLVPEKQSLLIRVVADRQRYLS
jgi:PilZ domain